MEKYLDAVKKLAESKKPVTAEEFNYRCDCLYNVNTAKNEYAKWFHGDDYERLNELYLMAKHVYQTEDCEKSRQRECYEIAEQNLFGFLENRPTKIRKLK